MNNNIVLPPPAAQCQQLILPTQALVYEFIADTEQMENMDYDIDEILSNAFTALAYIPDMQNRINDFVRMYTTWSTRTPRGYRSDGEILGEAFAKLVRELLNILKRLQLWDGTGFFPFYYHDRTYYDCILMQLEPG